MRKQSCCVWCAWYGRALPPSDFRDAPRPRFLSCAKEAAMCAIEPHSLLLSKCVHSVQRTRRCDRIACYSVLLLLCDDGWIMAPEMLRLRSSSQMRGVNTQGTAAGGVWLRPSVCVRAIGTRCRRGSTARYQKLKIWRVTPGCVRDADRKICVYRKTQFCKLRIEGSNNAILCHMHLFIMYLGPQRATF